MEKAFNDSVKERFKKPNNDIVIEQVKTIGRSPNSVERVAHFLSERFNQPDNSSFPFYCKVAIYLTDGEIDRLLATALNGRQPAHFFSYLASGAIKEKRSGITTPKDYFDNNKRG